MKNLKEIIVLFVIACLTPQVWACDPTVVGSECTQEEKQNIFQRSQKGLEGQVALESKHRAAEMLNGVYQEMTGQAKFLAVGQAPKAYFNARFEEEKQRVSGAGSASEAFQIANKYAQNQCLKFASSSVRCCQSPDACAGGFSSTLKNVAPIIGVLGGLLGGGGAASQCLGSLPQITSGLSTSMGVSKACRLLKNGGSINYEGTRKEVIGSDKICENAVALLSEIKMTPEESVALAPSIQSLNKQIREVRAKHGKQLQASSGKANEQSKGMDQALQGAAGCAEALLAGDDVEEGDVAQAVDCGNPSDAASNPSICQGYGSNNNGFDALGKTSGLDLSSTGGLQDDEPDDDLFTNNNGGTPQDTPFGSAQGKSTNASLIGGNGSSGAGANQKAGRRRGAGKGKKLVSGYKTSKGGSSGSYGGSRKPAFKGFKKFKGLNTDKNKDNAALAALSKLVKAGISPDSSESIFKRISNRFTASTAKEKLFDAKRNKKLWMEK